MMCFGALITFGVSYLYLLLSFHFTKSLGGSESLWGAHNLWRRAARFLFLLTGERLYEKYGIG